MANKEHTVATVSSDDMDDAATFAGEKSRFIDPAIENRAVRKIDLFFIPTMILGYGLVYYDKVSGSSHSWLRDLVNRLPGYPRECRSVWHGD